MLILVQLYFLKHCLTREITFRLRQTTVFFAASQQSSVTLHVALSFLHVAGGHGPLIPDGQGCNSRTTGETLGTVSSKSIVAEDSFKVTIKRANKLTMYRQMDDNFIIVFTGFIGD
jgi:hypothetical protein